MDAKKYLKKIGQKGGQSKSPKKLAASLKNLQLANEKRLAQKLANLTIKETRGN